MSPYTRQGSVEGGLPVLTVTQCVREFNAILETQVVAVEGEVQSLHLSQGKWAFFSLKDQESLLECFLPLYRLTIPLEDGMTVRVLATPKIYAPRGKLSLTVERIEAVGEGALRRAFELLKRKLEEEGLFRQDRKRQLPRFPERIGLIASRESAAYSDFLKVLNARFSDVEIIVAHVPVQGATAVSAVYEALNQFASFAPPLDVIVMTRGGGSVEDLMSFNDEQLARAVFRSPVPVVSAIGHERDQTILDYVADLRASTPSNAAELITPHRREVLGELQAMRDRMDSTLGQRLMVRTHQLDRVSHYLAATMEILGRRAKTTLQRFVRTLPRLEGQCREAFSKVRHQGQALEGSVARSLVRARERLGHRESLILSVSPERVLKRGYSIVRRNGRVVKSASEVKPHNTIEITLHDGRVDAEIV